MDHKRVTVLRGGPSAEYDVSMRTGAAVLRSLAKQYSGVSDVIITKDGEWMQNGIAKSPERVLSGADVVFLGLHGQYGEDGEVQKILQRYNLPFTGSRSLPSAIAFNKHLTKESLRAHGVLMPEHALVTREDGDIVALVANIAASFGPEYVVKPLASGSSVGVERVKDGYMLASALERAFAISDQVLVEEYIRGREATCATMEGFRNQDVYVFPAIEIIPPLGAEFFTTEAKYSGETAEICPGNFSYKEREAIAEITELVHRALHLSQYSRSDFIVRNGKPYFLEVNTLPGLTDESLFPKAAAAVGLSYDGLINHLVETAQR
jgi:D-alanine-D-alanine ligase